MRSLLKAVSVGVIALFSVHAIAADPTAIAVTIEHGFVDIDIPIVRIETQKDGTVTVIARGAASVGAVGFAFDLYPAWKANPTAEREVTFHVGKARFRSLGPESDRFVLLLASLYRLTPPPSGSMRGAISVDAVGLDSDPAQILTAPVKMKMFFGSTEEDEAEVFLNIDLKRRVLEFHEKDPDYRKSLIDALARGT